MSDKYDDLIAGLDEEWETSSGLPLADVDVVVTDVTFGFNAKIGADVLCANFTFLPIDGDGETVDQSFSVGKNWEAKDKGAFLQRPDGGGGKINGNTNYGRLIESARVAVEAAKEDMPVRSPRIAKDWVGTKWHVSTVKVTSTNPTTGKETEKDAFVFTAYLGKGDADTKKSTKATSTKATASKKAVADDGDDELDTLRATLVALAKEHESHEAFMDAALEIPGVENGPLERAVLKAKGDGSIWAEANS